MDELREEIRFTACDESQNKMVLIGYGHYGQEFNMHDGRHEVRRPLRTFKTEDGRSVSPVAGEPGVFDIIEGTETIRLTLIEVDDESLGDASSWGDLLGSG